MGPGAKWRCSEGECATREDSFFELILKLDVWRFVRRKIVRRGRRRRRRGGGRRRSRRRRRSRSTSRGRRRDTRGHTKKKRRRKKKSQQRKKKRRVEKRRKEEEEKDGRGTFRKPHMQKGWTSPDGGFLCTYVCVACTPHSITDLVMYAIQFLGYLLVFAPSCCPGSPRLWRFRFRTSPISPRRRCM